ncbi:MAG: SBBP repeat-containing protein [Acidobacteriota bacterium]
MRQLGVWTIEGTLWFLSLALAIYAGLHLRADTLPGSLHRLEPNKKSGTALAVGSSFQTRPTVGRPFDEFEGETARRHLQAAYGRLPLTFEENRGQAPDSIRFLSRGSRHNLLLLANRLEFQLTTPDLASANRFARFGIRFEGANPKPEVRAEQPVSTRSHYLVSSDPTQWQTDIPHYSQVRYEKLYPGIDLLVHGAEEMMEYDFVISPGAPPELIQLRFENLVGQSPLRIGEAGDLVFRTASGEMSQKKPFAYQDIDGERHPVSVSYQLAGKDQVGFALGSYDSGHPLVIDPVLSYSTVGIGGFSIAVDSQRNAYVVGTAHPAFVTSPDAVQSSHAGGACVSGPNTVPCPDILVAKLNSSGTELLYATFLGGMGSDYAYSIAVDPEGNAYLTGTTSSGDFPVTPGAFQTFHSSSQCGSQPCGNAFLTKINPTGTELVYSTYLHGAAGGQGGNGVAVDRFGNAYVTGDRDKQGFVTKLTVDGSSTLYTISGVGGSAIAVDDSGSAYVTGRKGYQSFVTKLSPEATSVIYSFRLGGSSPAYTAAPEEVEAITGIAVDGSGSAYVTGYTAYQNFPTTEGAPFRVPPGAGPCGGSLCRDAFIAKVNAAGDGLVYSTYLGGSGIDYSNGIAVDLAGNAYVTGATRSSDFPQTAPLSSPPSGGVFVAKLNRTGTALKYSLTLGSAAPSEGANGIAVDVYGRAHITGGAGLGFPVTSGAFEPVAGSNGSFVAAIFDDLTLFVPIVLSSSGLNGTYFTSELTLTNRSHQEVQVEFFYAAAFGGGSGQGSDRLGPGKQVVIPDAIEYLRSLGVPIPTSGNRGGTLSVRFTGLSSPDEAAATVRTTSQVSNGRAGLAYSGVFRGFTGTTYLCGLRQDGFDRTNVAIQHAGFSNEGNIKLRLTVFSGNLEAPLTHVLPEQSLAPGEFRQISEILRADGLALTSGFVKIERLQGTAPYYAYAVINDQLSGDGSFIPPAPEKPLLSRTALTIPVVVETATFKSELVITNWSSLSKTVFLSFVSDSVTTPNSTATLTLFVHPQGQLIVSNVIELFRRYSVPGIGPPGTTHVGALSAVLQDGDASGLYLGARTSAPATTGRYGVAYSAVSSGLTNRDVTWLYGLRQDDSNRTNLGLVNSGDVDSNPVELRIDLFDGDTGLLVGSVEGVELANRKQLQIDSILARYASESRQAYARITRTAGRNGFIAYTVINDGAQPGERSGDGAFLYSIP